MARINVEDHKKAIFALNGIPPFEEEMTFYYDESGNCRKFSLTDAGFNNTDALKGDFVLAGVAHEGRSFDIDVSSMSNLELYENDIHLSNWQFVKSHENIYVQVSDLIAGLLRKLFLFLDENPLTDIISIAMKLKDAQVKNFTLLWMLIRKSDEKSPLFIKNTNSQKNVQERMLKLQLLGVSNKESL